MDRLGIPTRTTASDDPTHPIQMILRTYALGLSFSLGPSLIPFISSHITSKPSPRTSLPALKHVLRRDFGLDGFAFAITVCVGGGAAIRRLWRILASPKYQAYSILPMSVRTICRQCNAYLQALKMTSYYKTFLANVLSSFLGVLLLQAGYRRSRRLRCIRDSSTSGIFHSDTATHTIRALPTLDFTLLLLVRALDAILQTFIHRSSQPAQPMVDTARRHPTESTKNQFLKKNANPDKQVRDLISRTDAFVFWACSAR